MKTNRNGGKSLTAMLLSVLFLCAGTLLYGAEPGPADNPKLITGSVSGNGVTNWTDGYIEASGEGAAASWEDLSITGRDSFRSFDRALDSAKNSAALNTRRKLLDRVNAMFVDADSSVGELAAKDKSIAQRIDRYLRSGLVQENISRRETDSNGVIRTAVTIRVPIYGKDRLADIVRPAPAAGGMPAEPVNPDQTAESIGLVIDARGLTVHPALFPRIFDEDGAGLHRALRNGRTDYNQNGLVGYSRSLETSKIMAGGSAAPALIKAVRVTGANGTDLVIAHPEAAGIERLEKNPSFRKRTRIIFLVD